MKMTRRLFAVMMTVVMILTLVPFGLFAYAEEGDPIEISTFADLKKIGTDDWTLDKDYILTGDIILLTADEKLVNWFDEDPANEQEAGNILENVPQYVAPTEAFENYEATDFYKETYVEATVADQAEFEAGTYYILEDTDYVLADSYDELNTYYEKNGEYELADAEEVTELNFDGGKYFVIEYTAIAYASLTSDQKDILIDELKFVDDDNEYTMPDADIDKDFEGTLDGDGHTISGMIITSDTSLVGLFCTNKGTIKDLTLDDKCEINLKATNSFINYVGSFAAFNDGELIGLTSNATINVTYTDAGPISIGGIVGGNLEDESVVTDCAFGGTINFNCASATLSKLENLKSLYNANVAIGGIVGSSANELVTGSTFTGTIETNLLGGAEFAFYEIVASGKVLGDKISTIPVIEDADRTVDDLNADPAFLGDSVVLGDLSDDDYQLVTITTADGTYNYVRKLVCEHTNLTDYPANPYTCTTDGNSAYWECEQCHAYFSDAEAKTKIAKDSWILPAKHTLEKTAAKAATCIAEGNTEYYTCTANDCGKFFSDAAGTNEIEEDSWITSIDSSNHKLVKTAAVAATCTKQGNTTYYTCSDCGKFFSDAAGTDEIEEDSWITSVDGDNHKLVKTAAVAATCTKQGNTLYYTCSECGKYFDAEKKEISEGKWVTDVNPSKHKLVKTAAKAATCTTKGNTAYYTCSDCGKYFSDSAGTKAIAKNSWVTSHTLTYVKAKAATCTEAGNRAYYKCSCGKKYADKACKELLTSVTTKATGHTYGSYVSDKNATTSKDGTKTKTCTKCGNKITVTDTGSKIPTVKVKSSSGYKLKTISKKACIDNVVPKTKAGISVKTFKSNLASLPSGYSYVVRNLDGKAVTKGVIATGFTVEVKGYASQTKKTIVVKGDVNKDGKITSKDYVSIKNHISGKKKITSKIILAAADFNNDSKVNSTDYVKVKKLISSN